MSVAHRPEEPESHSGCRALDSDVGWGLATLLRRCATATAAAMDDVPGGQRGFHVLAAVAGDHPESQLVLARRLAIDRTVMTYLLDDLERAGLVQRCADPQDRRTRRLVATDAGGALLLDLHERVRGIEDQLLAALAPVERDAFRRLLRRLACGADDQGAAGALGATPSGTVGASTAGS